MTLISASYDALDRRISLGGSTIADRTYGYDLVGRMTSSTFNSGGASFAATQDALDRKLTQVGQGTLTNAYDTAGRRTRLTYAGSGLFVDYEYHVAGEMAAIRENGASSAQGCW